MRFLAFVQAGGIASSISPKPTTTIYTPTRRPDRRGVNKWCGRHHF
jgi:hypothetical protein